MLKISSLPGGAPKALLEWTKTNSETLDVDDRLGTLEPSSLAHVLVDGRPDEHLVELAKSGLSDPLAARASKQGR